MLRANYTGKGLLVKVKEEKFKIILTLSFDPGQALMVLFFWEVVKKTIFRILFAVEVQTLTHSLQT